MALEQNPLPYTDTKPVGAADFYFAINATFRFILRRRGIEGLRRYWRELGSNYYRPVSEQWKQGGLSAVAEYWKKFFEAEPGAVVEVTSKNDEVRLDVITCPAIKHLRDHGREIVPCFCQHCHFVSEAMAAPAGLTVRIKGGNGSCVQRFIKRDANVDPQNLEEIASVS
ncbi:MAG TPA: hypothetical protein VGH65_08100 [Verrucomicrobiaceae bacterium]|jgi:hypothetical protein